MTSTHPTGGFALFRRLLRYIVPHRMVLLVTLLTMTVAAATEPLFASLMQPLVDVNFVSRDADRILVVPLEIIAVFAVRGIAGFVNEYAMAWLSGRIVFELRRQMFDRLLSLPSTYFDHQQAGKLMSRFLYDAAQVTQAGANLVTISVKDSLTLAGLLGYLFYMDWLLTIVCILSVPILAPSIKAAAKRLRSLSRDSQTAAGDLTHVLEESIHCQRIVKVFGGQARERQRLNDASNRLRLLGVKQSAASSANSAFVQWIVAIALAAIVYIASLRSVHAGLSAGQFVAYMTAMLMLFAPLKRLTSVNVSLQKGLAAAESVFALLDEESEPDNGTRTIGRARGEIVIENLSFRYSHGSRDILRSISLRIAPGEVIALVGSSGSGKTTLASLLPRFYEANTGDIRLDGIDLRELALADLRRNIALVSQDTALFNDTIAGNIAYGAATPPAAEAIIAAARSAHVLEFAQDMPDGLDTFIGDKGVRLSGGQKQRIAIARALLKDAPILILDEATSALDSASEKVVQAALENLMRGRTTIVIAHRLSTVKNVDRIFVMQKGEIVEIGGHDELLARGGIYAGMWQMQFAHDAGVSA